MIQKDYKNLQGRSAILDCVAKDEEGRQFDVEIQQDNEGALCFLYSCEKRKRVL